MGFTLAIVERAHRGAVEQQYAHVLWLAHGLHRQSPMTVLLRGMACVYALEARAVPPVDLAGAPWGSTPDYSAAIARLHEDGATVLVSADSLQSLGLTGRPILATVTEASDVDIARLVGECDRVWYL